MGRAFRYIAKVYIKNFMILLLGLSLAVVFIDFLQHSNDLQGGANQKILYIFYRWESFLLLIYPLVIIFAAIMTQMSMIRNNTLVALFSFGYSKRQLFRPLISVAAFIYAIFISLQFTPFAYSEDIAYSILKKEQSQIEVQELFFKYNSSFVYVKELDPVHKVLYDTRIFVIRGGKVIKIVSFKRAYFANGYWVAPKASIKEHIYINGQISGFRVYHKTNLALLEGYEPKVIKLIYEGHSLKLDDAINAYILLKSQGLDSSKVKATIYNKVVMPLFALAMVMILFFKIPVYQRFLRAEFTWALALGSTLVGWGVLYALYRLSTSGVVPPDFAQLPLVILLLIYGFWLFVKDGKNHK